MTLFIAVILGLAVLLFAKLFIGYFAAKKKAETEWNNYVPVQIKDWGSVPSLEVLPLVDWNIGDNRFSGEPGVSWLITAGKETILMDVGFNLHKEEPAPLLRTMGILDRRIQDIHHIFISHLHMDHVGGLHAQNRKTIQLSKNTIDLSHVTIYAPTEMRHTSARIQRIDRAQVLFPGIASEGPIAASIFAMGYTLEQALVVNVAGKGLVLIVGCGHQGLRKIFERAESLFDIPVFGLIGGLHYPVTASRLNTLGIPMQKILGTGKLPWQRISKEEVRESIEFLKTKDLGLVSISAHDSCDWTIQEFKNAFGAAYRDLKVGIPIIV